MNRQQLSNNVRALAVVALSLCAAVGGAQDATSSAEFDTASLRRETEEAVRLAEGLKLQVSNRQLREGEALGIKIDLPRSGYLNLVSIGPDGVPTVLFPNSEHADNKVEAGRFVIPTAQMKFKFKAAPPFGESLIAAFLTVEPVDLYASGGGKRDASGALLSQFAQLSFPGRDVIKALSTKSLVVEATETPPLTAGMTTITTCATTGPCGADVEGGEVLKIVDALAPGIFLEPEDKELTAKVLKLRPVYEKGLKLTKVSEGFVPRLYHDSASYCTIGYGHLVKLRPCNGTEPRHFRKGLSEPAGGSLLVSDMARAQRAVMALVKTSLTDGQFAALCDFTYNVGVGNLKRSTLLKRVNAGQHRRVPFQFRRWNKAGGKVLRGLKIRREREIALYLDDEGGKSITIPKAPPPGEDVTPVDIRAGESGDR